MDQIYLQFYLNKKFLHACASSNLKIVENLIKYNKTIINYDFRDIHLKYNGFMFACYNNDFEVIKLLIKNDININFDENVSNYWGDKISPFKITIKNTNILKLLIKSKKYSNLNINYLYLKIIKYDQELIDLMKTEKFLSTNNRFLILEFLRNIKILKSFKYQQILPCNTEDCSICLEPLFLSTYKTSYTHVSCKLPCNHEFHFNCIEQLISSVKEQNKDSWSQMKLSCPLCRNPFKDWGEDMYEFDSDGFDSDGFDSDEFDSDLDLNQISSTDEWIVGRAPVVRM